VPTLQLLQLHHAFDKWGTSRALAGKRRKNTIDNVGKHGKTAF